MWQGLRQTDSDGPTIAARPRRVEAAPRREANLEPRWVATAEAIRRTGPTLRCSTGGAGGAQVPPAPSPSPRTWVPVPWVGGPPSPSDGPGPWDGPGVPAVAAGVGSGGMFTKRSKTLVPMMSCRRAISDEVVQPRRACTISSSE